MRRILSWLVSERTRGERGQMLIIFALIIAPVTFAVGAVAVDASVWQSERRGAQKDADFAALSGGLELVFAQNKANAENAAISNANANDEAGNADAPVAGADADLENIVVVDDACFPGNTEVPLNAVTVNLNHDSRTFFAEAFGMNVAPEIGAHARACVGSITNPEGLRPFAIDIDTSTCFVQPEDNPSDPGDIGKPYYGADCVMDFGAQGAPGGPNRGLLDLEADPNVSCSINGGGSADLLENIKFGAEGNCYTNPGTSCSTPYTDCVLGKTGNVAGKVPEGIKFLADQALQCDGPDSNNYDDFTEALEIFPGGGSAPPSPNNTYMPKTCSDGKISERLFPIVVIDIWPTSNNNPIPIRYFSWMFVTGCENPSTGVIYPMCPKAAEGPQGHIRLHGIIFKIYLVEAGDIAAPNDSGTVGVALDE